MNDIEAINLRKSVRNYSEESVELRILESLSNKIKDINDTTGLRIELVTDGSKYFNSIKISYGMFAGIKSLIVVKGEKNDSDLKEKAGYYGERLMLDLTKQGLGSCWVGGTYDKAQLEIANEEEVIALITFGYAKAKEKLVTVLAMKRMHANSKSVDEMISDSSKEAPRWFLDGVDAVTKAPSAINEQKVKLKYDGTKAIIYTESTRHTAMTDLGIAKLHFEIIAQGEFKRGDNAEFIKK